MDSPYEKLKVLVPERDTPYEKSTMLAPYEKSTMLAPYEKLKVLIPERDLPLPLDVLTPYGKLNLSIPYEKINMPILERDTPYEKINVSGINISCEKFDFPILDESTQNDKLTLLEVAKLYMRRPSYINMFNLMTNGWMPPVRYIHHLASKTVEIKSFSLYMIGPLVFANIITKNNTIIPETSTILACHVSTGVTPQSRALKAQHLWTLSDGVIDENGYQNVNFITQNGNVFHGCGKTDAESLDIMSKYILLIRN